MELWAEVKPPPQVSSGPGAKVWVGGQGKGTWDNPSTTNPFLQFDTFHFEAQITLPGLDQFS